MGALTMTKHEREAFLAGTHIGVLAVAGDSDGAAPTVTPIWYSYDPGGDVIVTTDRGSKKTDLLRSAGHASFCVQTETAPYQYVVVEGPVAISDGVDSQWRRTVSRRFLGDELGDAYADSTMDSEATAVTVRLTPQRWRTTDYGKLF
ncbi:MAG TPA: pyridoxamine 5'-phosphate oxidase family protein [Acidimicrobiales bacterium]|jgi:PPOX class probable F420-dependent enzyme